MLTSRHHDGVALWDTAYGAPSVGRDLIGGYAEALREQGRKVGLYYSHSDWSHPDDATTRTPGRPPELADNRYSECSAEDEDLEAWERFLAYRDGQIRDLTSPTGRTFCGSTASGSAARNSGAPANSPR